MQSCDAYLLALISIQTSHHLVLRHWREVVQIDTLALENFTCVWRNKTRIHVRGDREFCGDVRFVSDFTCLRYLPCLEKSNRFGSSFDTPFGCLESGKRQLGSRSSSKNGWHMASMAERRWVGVYSRRAAIRSMASGDALRNTWWRVSLEIFRSRTGSLPY